MTKLNKPVSRRTSLDPRLGQREAGEVTVTLYPDNSIGFRKLKHRHEVRLSLAAAYSIALKSEARDQQILKAQIKKERRQGIRIKK